MKIITKILPVLALTFGLAGVALAATQANQTNTQPSSCTSTQTSNGQAEAVAGWH